MLNAAPFSFFNVLSGRSAAGRDRHRARAAGDAKDTATNVRETQQFVVNLVGYENAEGMNVTAIELPAAVDEIAQAGLHTAPSVRVAPPRIAESPVALECERFTTLEVGAGPGADPRPHRSDARARRSGDRRREVLCRHAEARADRAHARRRLVCAHDRPVRDAAYSRGGLECSLSLPSPRRSASR